MQKIFIEQLETSSLIGVYDWERKNKQRLLIDIELQADLSTAAKSDDVEDTLNYAQVAATVIFLAQKAEFKLIEALANNLVTGILEQFPLVSFVKLKLSKPDILSNAKNVAVEFSKGQEV
ncbi:dihydroneopterin aldolase [Paraglaciecola aquimarina]|uniref:7,8-dihydroneopterin aldolase n=1 Tax=Paraglaciecola algarum TaxID=3050085 RepID=A0ABS9DAQ8_9ALTE|nr:dihydroneopterin aldolase [Paraglaciecola sp. G1-23]MCF2950037.1 dihydroneopterin aldolase [Paraglaciecola sp. G1-23]